MNKYINKIITYLILLLITLVGYCIFLYLFFYLNIFSFKISEEGIYYFVFALLIMPLMLSSLLFIFITKYLIKQKQFKEIKFIYFIPYYLFIGFSYLPITAGIIIYLISTKQYIGPEIFDRILAVLMLIIIFIILPLIIPTCCFYITNSIRNRK